MINRPLLCCVGLLAVVQGAQAASVRAQSFEELTQSATLVVRAVVRTQHVAWDASHRRLHTYSELQVTDSLKGGSPAALVIRTVGGELNGVGQRVEGAPTFASGEQVVLFLEPAPDEAGVYLVSALAAGKVRLERRGAHDFAVRDLRGLGMFRANRVTEGGPEELGRAEDFLLRIRAAVRATGAPR